MRPALLVLLLVACTPEDGGDTDVADAAAAALALERTEDVNGTVTTKGLGVLDDGRIALWNYNQDQLEIWDGGALSPVASGLVTGFGTDLHTVGEQVFVTKGDSGDGDRIGSWGADGTPGWGKAGLAQFDGMWLGLDALPFDGMHRLVVADASTQEVAVWGPGDQIDWRVPVDGVPLDVAVGQALYVLLSTTTTPIADEAPVTLVGVDPIDGAPIYGPVEVDGGTYLTVLDGRVAVSVNDFDAETRSLAVFSTDLAERIDTALPASYTGFVGGMDTHDGAIYVSAQEGTGSDPICDVLVYTLAE